MILMNYTITTYTLECGPQSGVSRSNPKNRRGEVIARRDCGGRRRYIDL